MSVRIEIPAPMRELTNGQIEVPVEGKIVQEALDHLIKLFPALKTKLFDDRNLLRQHINIFVNDEDIRYLDEMNTAVAPGTLIALIPAVAGG